MKLVISSILLSSSLLSSASAFVANSPKRAFNTVVYGTPGMDLSGNNWQPESGEMKATDTGDFFPDGYDRSEEIGFTEGMYGSQASLGNKRSGPELPGMENLGEDAVMMGGIEENSDIPAGMEFIPSSVPDGEYSFDVAASSRGGDMEIEVKPFCMGFEDYFAAFAPGSHPSLKVSPCAGRMDRRGGESTFLIVSCQPGGQSGNFQGDLVINLPEDNSKLTYKISCNSF